MASSQLLLSVARELQYEPVSQLVGIELTINSLATIFDPIAALAKQYLDLNLESPEYVDALNRKLAGPIGKYGLIDFEYSCDAKIASSKTENVQILRDFGFAHDPDAESDDRLLVDDDSEYCIREIHEGISQNQTWLKLFFNTTDVGFSKLDMNTRFRQTMNPELIQFPMRFRVNDACLTNAPFIWFNRHFYI